MESNQAVCHILLKKAIKKGVRISPKVEGESMLPTLKPGQTITLEHVPFSRVQVGDILVFRGPAHNVVHRLIETVEKDGKLLYITKGDNNLTADPPASSDKIIGRISSVDGKKMSELESLEQRALRVEASKKQERLGRRMMKGIMPLYRIKVALIGRRSLGIIRWLKKLTRPI